MLFVVLATLIFKRAVGFIGINYRIFMVIKHFPILNPAQLGTKGECLES
jgi:hypothetical protein